MSNGGTASAALTVAPGDSLKITSTTWSNSTKLLQVNGTGPNSAATLQVQDGKSNAILGTMTNLGNGNYSFQLTAASAAPPSERSLPCAALPLLCAFGKPA